ncbi:MAG: amidase [Gammaproteobacteria bacterium]|nr:amidase [Gammaproteobacteria bacterium]
MDPSRRALLIRAMALAAASALPWARPLAAMPAASPFARLDATGQAALLRRGEVSALELVDAAIARIESLDGAINAVTTRLFERAREQAQRPLPDGPFRGVPYLIKDLNDLEGTRNSMGSRIFADQISAASEPYVTRTLDTGVVVVGKSNTPEFGLLGTTESLKLGVCRNPWNPDHTPGGSSGGAAAAVAAGLVPFAHATDGGGSIRIPAACCNLFGLKPSRGRLGPREVDAIDLSVQHCVSHSVRDSARLFAATEYRGANARLPPVGHVTGPSERRLRIAFDTSNLFGDAPHPEVEIALQQAAKTVADLGHQVEEARPNIDGAAFVHHFITIWASFPLEPLAAAEAAGLDPESVLEPWTLDLAAEFARRGPEAVAAAEENFAAMNRVLAAFFERYDVLMTPVLKAPPVRIGEQAPTMDYDELYSRVTDWVSYTPLHNAAGTPAMSVPLGMSCDGLPIGVQFAAAVGAERTLFELAYQLEAAAPWARRQPPIHAG